MTKQLTLIFIILITSSCSNKYKLTDGSWLISEAYYQDQKVEFLSKNFLVLTDQNGKPDLDLRFSEGGTIILPGINCTSIRSLWKIENNQLYLSIDSARYNLTYDMDKKIDIEKITKGITSQERKDSLIEVEITRLQNWQNLNPLVTNEYSNAMQVYSGSFTIKIKGDFLLLTSETTVIKAQKDRRVEEMFNGL